MNDDIVILGKIGKKHGLKGELRLEVFTDFAEDIPNKKRLFLFNDNDLLDVKVNSLNCCGKFWTIHFQGIDNADDADKVVGMFLGCLVDDLMELENDEYYYHDLVGCEIISHIGEKISIVKEVIRVNDTDMLIIDYGKQERFIPFINQYIKDVDIHKKIINVELPNGFLDY